MERDAPLRISGRDEKRGGKCAINSGFMQSHERTISLQRKARAGFATNAAAAMGGATSKERNT
jgi:hypothetical protein